MSWVDTQWKAKVSMGKRISTRNWDFLQSKETMKKKPQGSKALALKITKEVTLIKVILILYFTDRKISFYGRVHFKNTYWFGPFKIPISLSTLLLQ